MDNPRSKLALLVSLSVAVLLLAGCAIAAVDMLHARGFSKVVMICMVSCPEGIKRFEAAHPFVPIYTAAVDDHLNEHNYIVPGLGDAGDRIFGTK